tara:strand:- start:161 stop:331 length:171 start_codon:yes stop_codon:yes gene_type:complete
MFICGSIVKDNTNIYIEIKISTLDRFENYNKYNKNKQYCGNFINYSKKFRRFGVFF